MPWYLHLYWGAVVYLAAVVIGRGVATAGEWIAKAILRSSDATIALQRELRSDRKGRA